MSEARPIRDAVETVIFGTETRGGNLFDVALLITILASVAVVMLDSMDVYMRSTEISFGPLRSASHWSSPWNTWSDFGAFATPWPMPSAFGALSIF